MSTSYTLSFEQIQLLSGLSPDQPVYLAMQLKAYNADTPNDPFYMETIGGLSPNDANAPADDSGLNFVSGSGLFSAGLVQGAITRNDLTPGVPRFTFGPFSLEDDQILEVGIVLAPEVWFSSVNVPASDFDKFLVTAFTTLVGASGFGIVGAAVGAIAGFLGIGQGSEDIPVPCYNVVIAARNVWTGADVAGFAGQGLMQFGPKGPAPSYGCDEIDSLYWLSIKEQMFFSKTPAFKPGDCTLDTVNDIDLAAKFSNSWGDSGNITTDCIHAFVFPASEGLWNISLQDAGSAGPTLDFRNVPVTVEVPKPVFHRNIYGNSPCPARSVTPNCALCSRLTNIGHDLYLPGRLLAAVATHPTHIGTRPLLPIQIDGDRVLGCGPTGIVRPLPIPIKVPGEVHSTHKRHTPAARARVDWLPERDAIRLNSTTVAYQPAPGLVGLSGKLSLSVYDTFNPTRVLDLFGCLTLRLSKERVLYLYSETPAHAPAQCFRIRYLHTDEDGNVVTDVMLLPDAAVIR